MNALSDYLKKHKITQMEFATKAGVSQTVISMYCSGKVTPTLKNATKIVKAANYEIVMADLISEQ